MDSATVRKVKDAPCSPMDRLLRRGISALPPVPQPGALLNAQDWFPTASAS